MSVLSGFSIGSLLALEVAVIDDLQASVVLLLESPEALLLLSLLLEKGLLDDLLVTLVKNSGLLLVIESLKVIRLDAVRCKHRGHGLGVLSHEVVSEGVVDLVGLLVGPILSLSELCIPLLVSELEIHLLSGAEHVSALGLVILLSFLEDLIEVYGLLIVGTKFLSP